MHFPSLSFESLPDTTVLYSKTVLEELRKMSQFSLPPERRPEENIVWPWPKSPSQEKMQRDPFTADACQQSTPAELGPLTKKLSLPLWYADVHKNSVHLHGEHPKLWLGPKEGKCECHFWRYGCSTGAQQGRIQSVAGNSQLRARIEE